MLMRHIGYGEKADALETALSVCNDTERRLVVTGDKTGVTCGEFVDYLMEKLN